ncbi:MAG TPA: DUF2066 domain-containing protein, partial [Xanthomonadales bacterium]|nr:DUF2066 domain-containing protein [Xanthomonadales bacterium]
MNRAFVSCLLFVIALTFAGRAGAAGVDIYSGEAAVASQTEEERQRAARPALSQALVKASGDA